MPYAVLVGRSVMKHIVPLLSQLAGLYEIHSASAITITTAATTPPIIQNRRE